MCGICGVLHDELTRPVPHALVQRMNQALTHRGPDGEGYFWDGAIALGMRRLQVIDLQTGDQPIYNEDRTVAVVFNGEIYNFPELRQMLVARGHTFYTQSDTEVIVHAYEEYGPACVERLNGMFVFALWDSRQRQVLLARDRTGQKPLFYYRSPQALVFASELKALLQHPDVPREVDPQAVYHYLSLQYVPGPTTILRGVMQLPAAHFALWRPGHFQIERYWQPNYAEKRHQPYADWVAETRETILAAVRRHLLSDVPLGAFLSGGVDSSIVVAAMAHLASSEVKTFSIGFDVEAYNETDHARRIAQRFRTDHHEFVVSQQQTYEALEDVVWHADQPLADTACLAAYQLSRLTRQHVTVALTGDGGDEAFAGYTRYVLDRWLRAYRLLPEWLRLRLIPLLAARIPQRVDVPIDRNFAAGLKRLAQASSTTPKASILAWGSYFSTAQKQWLGRPEWLAQIAEQESSALLAELYDAAQARSHLDRTLIVDLVLYLQDDLLVKADRMSMAHSLEARAPFLDNEVLDLIRRMPEDVRIKGRTQKRVLRDAFADLLPPQNVKRIKRGFLVPVAAWLRGELADYAAEVLLDERARTRGYFVPARVEQMLHDHRAGRQDHGQRLWALLVLELWHRQYIDGERLDQVRSAAIQQSS